VTVPLSEVKEQAKAGKDVLAYLVGEAEKRGKGGQLGDLPTGVQEVGCSHVLYRALEESGLGRTLTEAYGHRDGLALALLGMQAVADGRPLYLAAHWIAESAVAVGLEKFDLSSPGLSRFMRRIGADRESLDKFLGLWVAACGHPAALAMDTTSISTWAEDLDLAEWGHNRDHEKLPQVNLALACAREKGTPLAYRLIRGNVPDVASLKVTEELLAEYGLEEVSHALDRGFYSNANLRRMIKGERKFVVGVPFSVKQAVRLVRRHARRLQAVRRSFLWRGRVTRHVEDVWKVAGEDGKDLRIRAHVYFEPARRASRWEEIEQRVFLLEAKAGEEKFKRRQAAAEWLKENAGPLAGCFGIKADGGLFRTVRKPNRIARMAAHVGYSVVLGNDPDAGRDQVLRDWRSRDRLEKLFDNLKHELERNRLRTGEDEIAEGRMLTCFIGLILRSWVEHRLEASALYKELTVPEVLGELAQLKAVRFRSGRRVLLEITKKQREILAALDLPSPE